MLFLIAAILLFTCIPVNAVAGQAYIKHQFSDVRETDWFYPTVLRLVEKGYIAGYTDGSFKPQNNIRVSEFTKILILALDYKVGVSGGYWAEGYINKAKELGIIQDNEFDDYDRYITRGEMARMVVRAGTVTSAKEKGINLDVPENYKEYSSLITDYLTLNSESQDVALKVFTSGIISGFPDGSFGLNKNATRAEASAIMMRFLDKDRRKIPELPKTVDFSNTLTVKEFTEMALKAVGKEPTMEYAQKMEYVRPSAEYPSYEKPILRREATLTMARIMDDLTDTPALFTSGKNDLFVEGITLNHRPNIGKLINGFGKEYFTLCDWKDYCGHIRDIRMITEKYQKEMVTLYLAGIINLDGNKELRPYDFLTKEEAKEWIDVCEEYRSLSSDEVLAKLLKNIRELEKKSMPEVEKPSNANLWRSTYPYVNKRLYEYPLKLDKESSFSVLNSYNVEIPSKILKRFKPMYEIYFNTRYTVDYRNLDAEARYYSTYIKESGTGNYEKRVLFYHNPAQSTNGYVDEHGNKRKLEDIILIDKAIKNEIEKYKKYKVVSQAELITDESLIYTSFADRCRATLRIIYYPPTDPNFLKEQGLEVGKWYEKDILIDMAIVTDGAEEFKDRWEVFSF